MKICFLAPANSAHTRKWCSYFVSQGHEVHVVSFVDADISGATVHWVDCGTSAEASDVDKIKYLLHAGAVRRLVRSIDPDIINAHYATSYGTVAALAGLKNVILSVWGTDIFVFPRKSVLHRWLLQFSLARAKHLFSTSEAMAEEAHKYTSKPFFITPFGVDMQLFSPEKRNRGTDGCFRVGTVKSLSPAYGIDTLLKGCAIVKSEHPEIPLQIRIAGDGPSAQEYRALAEELGISEITQWLGQIPQEQAAEEWAGMDLAIICSNSESFGVAAVEAQSCCCPVIVSDIPGLMEATKPGETSLAVPCGNPQALAEAVVSLYENEEKRNRMGIAGREYVKMRYELNACYENIQNLFRRFLEK